MSIAANIKRIEDRIQAACRRSGRKRDEVNVMGVTKLQPLCAVDEAWKAGLWLFGESRVQEAAAKFTGKNDMYPGMELHMIGSLQRNKVKTAVSLFSCIQSLDRESLAVELAKCLESCQAQNPAGKNKQMSVLLELRTGEDSKSGFDCLDALFRVTEYVLGCPFLNIRGLMTIAPNTNDEKLLRRAFRRMVAAKDEMEKRYPLENAWSCLSMGMTGDFEVAVEEGSTLLRIGSAIFGGMIE